ncbi:hypothetical protein [Tumebacillus flagellatus]|uniref:Uncharacterized protein n=1 Tax=Tumebacillus flagellatus TaxID=1157490 RepID=A0A074LL97_9BACL|nr:hypothetical protein [Tumebacillus flagellatus]KEO82911.1 hypothetical protein EL26_12500 [Tumebacillus flagellatus]
MNQQDFCCGMTMVALLRSIYSEGGVLVHDVPMLVCPTCHKSHIVPDLEFDYIMLTHYCETDRVKVTSLRDAVGESKVADALSKYPEDERIRTGRRVVPQQIDSVLDLINVAKGMGDQTWHDELMEQLKKFSSYQQIRSR